MKSFASVNMQVDSCDVSFDDESNRLNLHLSSHNVHMSKAFPQYELVFYAQQACRIEQMRHHTRHKHKVFQTYASNGCDLPIAAESQNSYHIHCISVLPYRYAYSRG